jgi:hypothetical protein
LHLVRSKSKLQETDSGDASATFVPVAEEKKPPSPSHGTVIEDPKNDERSSSPSNEEVAQK